jgi:uncharacterized protein (DUF1499 family)
MAKILVSIVVLLMSSSVRADAGTLLPPCPSSPNCVSSLATDGQRIEPLATGGDAAASFARLKTVLANRRDTTVIAADEAQIRVEFRTTLGFVDDGLFVLDAANGQIQLRSAARSGYWDLGKNRRRLEEIRAEYSR